MTISEDRKKDWFKNWQLCGVWKPPFCDHRAIKRTQNFTKWVYSSFLSIIGYQGWVNLRLALCQQPFQQKIFEIRICRRMGSGLPIEGHSRNRNHSVWRSINTQQLFQAMVPKTEYYQDHHIALSSGQPPSESDLQSQHRQQTPPAWTLP